MFGKGPLAPGLFLVVAVVAVLFHTFPPSSALNLTVIHNNDFHTRFVPMKSKNYAECELDNATECIGGAARTVAEMKHLREVSEREGGNLLFLNAGDHFQGTFWYTILKSEVVAQFVSLMEHDVMAIGNHEFDDGPEELVSFIRKVKLSDRRRMSILSCNIVVNNGSEPLAGLIEPSTVKTIGGLPVAIIGYTTPDTKFLSKPGKTVTFRDEVVAIKEEIARLKALHPQLNIFIAVGHSGYERDLEIAAAIADLDLVVGGHSNTFLFPQNNGDQPPPPSTEKVEGDYPTVVNHTDSGERTLVVQAFAYGKYLGKLDLVFDEAGRVASYEGRPIFLSTEFVEDPQTKQLVESLSGQLNADLVKVIGFTEVDLDADTCRYAECNLGNLITDSMARYFARRYFDQRQKKDNEDEEAEVVVCNSTLAILNGGNIRMSISAGNITYKSVLSTLPFGNQQGVLRANGSELRAVFEHSARQFRRGGFMQVSAGLRVTYRHTGAADDDNLHHVELAEVEALCQDGWAPLDGSAKVYLVALNEFIAKGGDNYTMISSEGWVDYQLTDLETFTRSIQGAPNATAQVDGRLIFLGKSSASSAGLQMSCLVAMVTVVMMAMVKVLVDGVL